MAVLYFSIRASPASTLSHSISAPDASTTFTMALVTSGPIPSPGIKVTLYILSSPHSYSPPLLQTVI